MKFHLILFLLLLITITSFHNLRSFSEKEEEILTKQDINYTESTETLNNPGMGYTKTEWIYSKPNSTTPHDIIGGLTLIFWDIGGFSCGKNGKTLEDGTYVEGTDYDFDEAFFNGLNQTLFNVRKNGGTIALRFRYDSDEKLNPEPATFDKVLGHIAQIRDSKILEEYKDILMFVESGFVGEWGEQHSGKYTSLEYKSRLLDAVLDMVPDGIPVTVRTPDTAAKFFGVDIKELDKFVATKGSREARVGIYNDGYMGSDYDLGTYHNRTIETNWMNNQMRYTYYGGEFSSNINFAKKYTTYLPENSIPEMYKTHLTYINANIWNLYKDLVFNENATIEGVDNSAYYGLSAFKFIRDHLGYRFVLRESYISKKIKQGGNVKFKLIIENTGFANPIKEQKAEVILEKNGNYMKTEVDIDSTEWYSAMKTEVNVTLKIPGSIELGKWNIYLKLSVGKLNITNIYMRSVAFANENVYNPSIGANYIGNFEVIPSNNKKSMTDDSFYQIQTPIDNSNKNKNNNNDTNTTINNNTKKEIEKSNGELLTMNNMHYCDGRISNFEWTPDDLFYKVNNISLYVTNDDKNLYVMAKIPNNATSPVVNIQISVIDTNSWYWLYFVPGGNVFFNNGPYNTMTFRYTQDLAEFTIPFDDSMKLHEGTVLNYVRVFIQDLNVDWANVADIKSDTTYQIKDEFYINTGFRSVVLNKNQSYTINVENLLKKAKYQWIKDDEIIENANNKDYVIENADKSSVGVYSVLIKAENGIEKSFDICRVIDVY